jgi:hypothetical protein
MKTKLIFSKKDIVQIQRRGLKLNDVEGQLAIYRKGPRYVNLNRPCAMHDGILSIALAQRNKLIALYEKKSVEYKIVKFVPASGAASRMFAQWFSARANKGFGSVTTDQLFIRSLKKHPFSCLIKKDRQGNIKNILDYLLSPEGLNYGWLPKALIPFHLYGKGDVRTALEEHLVEGAHYIRSKNNICHLHFTVSPEHKKNIIEKIQAVQACYENIHRVKYKISLSVQSPSTDILAVDKNNLPFKDDRGNLVFRPGGHGTLLGNLQSLNADFIFVKNIDNIAAERLLKEIIPYKKIMGGLAMGLQEEIFSAIQQLKNPKINRSQIEEIIFLCSKKFNIIFPRDFNRQPRWDKIKFLLSRLNRPLRVCAMVKNEGEPGGGPFWVEEKDGTQSLQIVEKVHVDQDNPEQLSIWEKAQYFNPVDMVCCLKDYRGQKFKLADYVDHNAYLISRKNEKGRVINALEVPGLWNGAMAKWNTVFVKAPLIVFNPVKTVDDLLRPEHQMTEQS